MKVLFVGGGSGGHINPALAAAGYLKKREPDAEILYVGAKGAMEEQLVPKAGYPLKTIVISGFQRKLSLENLKKNVKTLKRIYTASVEARQIIKAFGPDVCMGTGGYVSGPVIREAAKLGIPCVIHESNAYPGVTTKMLAKQAKTVMLAVPEAEKYLVQTANCVVTGNPVRMELLQTDYKLARAQLQLDDRPLVLSFGGSLGAGSINKACMEMLKKSSETKAYQHIHGYGKFAADYPAQLKKAGFLQEDNPQIVLREYIDDMQVCLAAADLVICRAGAITLSEIQALGKASILIPSPNVAENHQYHNAMTLVNQGAARLIKDGELTGPLLWETLKAVLGNPEKAKEMGARAAESAILDANARIYREIKRAANQTSAETGTR